MKKILFPAMAWLGLLTACAPPMDYIVQEPWFKESDLSGRNIVMMPARLVAGENNAEIDLVLDGALREQIRGAKITSATEVAQLLAQTDAQLLTSYSEGESAEAQGMERLRKLMQKEVGATYILVPELKAVTRDHDVELAKEDSDNRKVIEKQRHVSRITASFKLSIYSTTDGALLWSGEGRNGLYNVACSSREVAKNATFSQALVNLLVDSMQPDDEGYPPYPPLDEVVKNAFTGVLLNIPGSSFSRKVQFLFSDAEPTC